jgi:hypothetical protein
VTQAEPAVRRIVHEERARMASAGKMFIPFAAAGTGGILGSLYAIPKAKKGARTVGLLASAAILGAGAYVALNEIEGPPEAAPPAPGPDIPFVGDVATQMAQAIVREAEPRAKAMVDEVHTDLAEAGMAALPFAALSAASFFGTAYMVPETAPAGKAAGYTAAAALMLVGMWRALTGIE